MGVGKTAQVLALLETRRALARPPERRCGPVAGGGAAIAGLQLEAGGGALHAAAARAGLHGHWRANDQRIFDDYDLVLTTYGTLRRDAVRFKDVEFDYVVLDEAQAIKNADTESAKAARLLQGGIGWR